MFRISNYEKLTIEQIQPNLLNKDENQVKEFIFKMCESTLLMGNLLAALKLMQLNVMRMALKHRCLQLEYQLAEIRLVKSVGPEIWENLKEELNVYLNYPEDDKHSPEYELLQTKLCQLFENDAIETYSKTLDQMTQFTQTISTRKEYNGKLADFFSECQIQKGNITQADLAKELTEEAWTAIADSLAQFEFCPPGERGSDRYTALKKELTEFFGNEDVERFATLTDEYNDKLTNLMQTIKQCRLM